MLSAPDLRLRARAELELRRRRKVLAAQAPTPPDLAEFARQAWHILEPRPYVHGWHIDAIFQHLEAVARGQIRNLIINMPPRHMKSLALVMWQAWLWTWQPGAGILGISYDGNLATRDAQKMRDIVESAWYRREFGVTLKHDQNQKTRFENTARGARIATSPGGRGLGYGGDYVIADDIHNRKDALNPDLLTKATDYWDRTISTRGNDPATVAKVVVMQRLHDSDLTGHLLRAMRDGGEHYEHLCLPARYDQSREPTAIGWSDPRGEEGALLWPARFDDAAIVTLERQLGSEAPGQLQQTPQAAGGNIFKAEWWAGARNRYDYADTRLKNLAVARYMFVDTALKDKDTNDNSAYLVADLLPDYRAAVRRVYQEKIISALLPQWVETAAAEWNRDGKLKAVVIEDKGSGTTTLQTIGMTAPAWLKKLMTAYMPEGSKEYRARTITPLCAADTILLPYPCNEAEWLFDFADPTHGELFRFPNADHDDRVDTLTCMATYLMHYLQQAAILNRGKAAA